MELALGNGFCELSQDEMVAVDGGVSKWVVAGVAAAGVLAISCAPATAAIMIVYAGTATTVAAGTALTMAGSGCLAIGAVNHYLK